MNIRSYIQGAASLNGTLVTVNDILNANLEAIREVIIDLPDTFDLHDFIRKVSKKIELDYVYLLATAGTTEPFQKVNFQIGDFLRKNQAVLRIQSQGKIFSKNVCGNDSECGNWRKV
ncbi:MAG: hypothetical protein RBQ91_07475 [Acholeplasma sp.]|nr:hypothetical protein [Acholeplasma sp.]